MAPELRRIKEDPATTMEETLEAPTTTTETEESTFDSRSTAVGRKGRSRGGGRGKRESQGAEANNVATQAMLGAIAELVQQTRTLRKDRARPPQELQFGGKYQEDPKHFLEELETFFQKEEIPERRKTPLAKTCFRAEAKQWVDKAIPTTVTWALFRSRFLDHYDSATQSDIARRLYGDDQSTEQDAFSFITERMALFDRVAPSTPEDRRIQTVVERLTPELRGLVRARDYSSMHQLIEYAVRFEGDLAAARAAQKKAGGKGAASSTTEKKSGQEAKQNNQGQKKGGDRQEAPPPKQQQQQQQGAKPPPPAAGGAAQGNKQRQNGRNLPKDDWRRDQRPPPPAPNQDWRRREAARPPPTSEASTSGPPQAAGNVARAEVVGDSRPKQE